MMGAMGRKGDSMIAHLTPGDVVLPRDIVLQNPEFLTKFKKAMQDNQSDYRTHIAGSGYENHNPETGAPEFGWLSKAWKSAVSPIQQISHAISSGNPHNITIAGLQGVPDAMRNKIGGMIGADPIPMAAPPTQTQDTGTTLGQVDQPFVPKQGAEPTKPFDLFSRDVGGQNFGSMDPTQQRSYLATQGSQGGGLGDEDKNYYLGLLKRNLIDESGTMQNMNTALLPVERNYLSRLGLPTDNTTDFFQALQS